MTVESTASDPVLQRAEELFRMGSTAAGCMHILLAARGLPESLRAYAPALLHYTALVEEMKRQAAGVQANAYAPYSQYRVGAALLACDGTIWRGCNVEASSYGLTMCAERSALVAAVSQGKRDFAAIAVITDSSPPASPCGACRQMLYEFAPDLLVVMIHPGGEERRANLRMLLPDAFASESLPGHRTGRDTTHYRADDIL